MDASKAQIKGVERKLAEEEEGSAKDMTNELANLNKLTGNKELPVIKIQEKDINFLQKELDFTFDEAKLALIKYQGDVKKVVEFYLDDFNFTD